MQINLWFWVLNGSLHNCKTIKWKLQNEKNRNTENLSLFNVAQSTLLMISNNYKVNEQTKPKNTRCMLHILDFILLAST